LPSQKKTDDRGESIKCLKIETIDLLLLLGGKETRGYRPLFSLVNFGAGSNPISYKPPPSGYRSLAHQYHLFPSKPPKKCF